MPLPSKKPNLFKRLKRKAAPYILAGSVAFGSHAPAAQPQRPSSPASKEPPMIVQQIGPGHTKFLSVERAKKTRPLFATIFMPQTPKIEITKTNYFPQKPLPPLSAHYSTNSASTNLSPQSATRSATNSPIVKPVPEQKQSTNAAVAKAARPIPSPKALAGPSLSVRLPARTISAAQIDAELAKMNSPLAGKGSFVLRIARAYKVNPAFFLAVALKESQGGTKGLATKTKNMCNVRWTSKSKYPNMKDFNVYPSWEQGVVGFFHQISRGSFYLRKGNHTVDGIIKLYAPPNENDTRRYIRDVEEYMRELGSG